MDKIEGSGMTSNDVLAVFNLVSLFLQNLINKCRKLFDRVR